MRLFTAINFGEKTIEKIEMLQDVLKAGSSRGNFTPRKNMHLTLVFIGECDERQTDEIKSAIGEIVFWPFQIQITGTGYFARGEGGIWHAKVAPCRELSCVQSELARRIRALGHKIDGREYAPHITFGREVITKLQPTGVKPFGETVAQIDLMKSERVAKELVYTGIFGVEAKAL